MDFRYYELPEDRQLRVLDSVIRLHTERAEPVSSAAVTRDLDLCWSSATIRNVFMELEELGWLVQPHRSAGRVPTDLGYRVYVERVIRPTRDGKQWERVLESELLEFHDGSLSHVLDRAAALISRLSHALGLSLLILSPAPSSSEAEADGRVQITGVDELLGLPEFEDPRKLRVLVHLLDDAAPVARYLREIVDTPGQVRVRIGEENRLADLEQFSLIGTRIDRSEESAVMGLLGPKRMDYPLVLASLEGLVELLHDSDRPDNDSWS